MNNKTNNSTSRITLSIPESTNKLLELIQYQLRNNGNRQFKSDIIHEALLSYSLDSKSPGNRSGANENASVNGLKTGLLDD